MEVLLGLLIVWFFVWRIYRKISTRWKMESIISKQYEEMKQREKQKKNDNNYDFRI